MTEGSMVTLEIDLNCMCLFVPAPKPGTDKGSVQVLMPCTHHAGQARHAVQIRYEQNGMEQARRMEGWVLVFGKAKDADARTELAPENGKTIVEVLDLTAVTVDEAHPD